MSAFKASNAAKQRLARCRREGAEVLGLSPEDFILPGDFDPFTVVKLTAEKDGVSHAIHCQVGNVDWQWHAFRGGKHVATAALFKAKRAS